LTNLQLDKLSNLSLDKLSNLSLDKLSNLSLDKLYYIIHRCCHNPPNCFPGIKSIMGRHHHIVSIT